jgi:hypothetical protein
VNGRRRTFGLLAGLPLVVRNPAAQAETAIPRSEHRVGTAINVVTAGARGDGRSDDTAPIQQSIDRCPEGGVVIFPGGRTYRTSNLVLKPGVRLQGDGNAVILALRGGNPAYLVATYSYAHDVPQSVDCGCEIDSLTINANNDKGVALAWRSYYGRVTRCRVLGATDTDTLVTTIGVSGAAMPAGSMVNNRFVGNWFGGAADARLSPPQFAFRVHDPSFNKATDIIFTGNYVCEALKAAAYFATAAGLLFQGNHVYGGATEFRKGFMGFACTGNYFEDPVIIDDITAGVAAAVIGPGNTLLADLVAKFGSHGDQIVSTGNHFVAQAGMRHCFNDASKVLVSIGDVFDSVDPVHFYQNDARSRQPSSAGIFQAVNSYLVQKQRVWQERFAGNRKPAG